jgi:polar amino acid transport system substrate-binding protein
MKILNKIVKCVSAVAMLSLLAAGPSAAQSISDLKAAGKIKIGMQVDFPPYGILNSENQPDGYEADVAKLVAERLGVVAEIVPVTGPNRIPNLLTGRVDLLVASLTITPERAKQVQFSNPYVAVDVALYGRKDLKAQSLDDLVGVTVAVPRASAQDIALTKNAPKGTLIQRFDDDPSTTQALLSGQVQALAAGTTVITQIEEVAPADTFEVKFSLYQSVFGIAMRPGQDDLLHWTNDFVAKATADGSLNKIHNKWFGKDLPSMETPDYIKH